MVVYMHEHNLSRDKQYNKLSRHVQALEHAWHEEYVPGGCIGNEWALSE